MGVSVGKCHAYFSNTMQPRLSKVSSEWSKLWIDSHPLTQHIIQNWTSQYKKIKSHVYTNMYGNINHIHFLISLLHTHLAWHLLGDTLVFAGKERSVHRRWCHSHRGQRRRSCGVHSTLENTSRFVCLEMGMWGGRETPSSECLAQEFFTNLTFTGVSLSPTLLCSACVHCLSVQLGIR